MSNRSPSSALVAWMQLLMNAKATNTHVLKDYDVNVKTCSFDNFLQYSTSGPEQGTIGSSTEEERRKFLGLIHTELERSIPLSQEYWSLIEALSTAKPNDSLEQINHSFDNETHLPQLIPKEATKDNDSAISSYKTTTVVPTPFVKSPRQNTNDNSPIIPLTQAFVGPIVPVISIYQPEVTIGRLSTAITDNKVRIAFRKLQSNSASVRQIIKLGIPSMIDPFSIKQSEGFENTNFYLNQKELDPFNLNLPLPSAKGIQWHLKWPKERNLILVPILPLLSIKIIEDNIVQEEENSRTFSISNLISYSEPRIPSTNSINKAKENIVSSPRLYSWASCCSSLTSTPSPEKQVSPNKQLIQGGEILDKKYKGRNFIQKSWSPAINQQCFIDKKESPLDISLQSLLVKNLNQPKISFQYSNKNKGKSLLKSKIETPYENDTEPWLFNKESPFFKRPIYFNSSKYIQKISSTSLEHSHLNIKDDEVLLYPKKDIQKNSTNYSNTDISILSKIEIEDINNFIISELRAKGEKETTLTRYKKVLNSLYEEQYLI
ncbi:hypothetical protein NEOLI_001749 [Neolecta irregularis DAH-3]|uniref:Uncharacterized protein n=1 Tax=Neolecta irregularis (strain DAH-3) TaxID=1198029 RepID=A0A1U7LW99_NEOID|nr:hypothetical protein NEOLI_001749 [Neolecta irregularis DAH-3]|eukprot:OLL26781.1 hypothetical protein NEOLI_001749 [Neolecta irregularis DAH-3]